MNDTDQSSRIAVFGLGYVGCVTAACLASLGHKVIGVDSDSYKVEEIREGRTPFYEPGLDEIVRATVQNGYLSASSSAGDALRDAEIALLCVGNSFRAQWQSWVGPGQTCRRGYRVASERRLEPAHRGRPQYGVSGYLRRDRDSGTGGASRSESRYRKPGVSAAKAVPFTRLHGAFADRCRRKRGCGSPTSGFHL